MKKHISLLTLMLFLVAQTTINAQEGTKIPFNTGTLNICSSKNFIVKGYNGKEVIIKNLNSNKRSNLVFVSDSLSTKLYNNFRTRTNVASGSTQRGISRGNVSTRVTPSSGYSGRLRNTRVVGSDSTYFSFFPSSRDKSRSKGLKKLGEKAAAEESGIYLKIEQKGNELTIKDDIENLLVLTYGEKYELTVPNSINIKWDTNECSKSKSYFFSSNGSEIKDFKGEVEISSSVNNFKLTDVSGPVSVNTIGGNVTVVFDKTTPNKLYSIYSNNGFIDITLPKTSSILVDAAASEILSDLDFKILKEENNSRNQQMNLKLGSGNTKMKLDADLGNIYLRKKQ